MKPSLAVFAALAAFGLCPPPARAQEAHPPENVYKADLVAFPGPWGFQIRRSGIILVRDEELDTLMNPDAVLNLSTGRQPRNESLRQICQRSKARGERTLMLAFDHFFRQYRAGQDTPRRLMPDMDEYIERIAKIGTFASQYGLGLELSLLTPLELGKAYTARTGESGVWMHYREGLRDPKTGVFSVDLWRQRRWTNNKGPFDIADAGMRVFAFREAPVPGTPYRAVDPKDIVEIKEGIQVERMENLLRKSGDSFSERIRVYGKGGAAGAELDHVLVVQVYRTPEMDYFSPKALPFLTGLVDKYAAAGIKLNALYSDEMHIQQDWAYFAHHDHGEFALRYVSPGLAHEYAKRYGDEYEDFAKYLVYFTHGQEDSTNDLSAKQGVMHTFGESPEAIRRTALFRARYYRMLHNGVVDLFVNAKHYTERKMGQRLDARAHATWAESPTIDNWDTGQGRRRIAQYEYTSNFVWSNTVHQAAAACDDYFEWGDFLTGNGNDHAEGGWIDRDYFALALGASTGILNEVPYSYAAAWGIPSEIRKRRQALQDVYGDAGAPSFNMVQDLQHRDADVLMLYPLDLVAVEERFGSWTVQYGYTNYVTAAKLLERGKVNGKVIEMAGRRFTTLMAAFEPFPRRALLDMMKQFAANGGRVIWSGPPPELTFEGQSARAMWQEVFGVAYQPVAGDGVIAPGKLVTFDGTLKGIEPQVILTDLLVDRLYPVTPAAGTEVVARVKNMIVGTRRGTATYLGFRPRDDQSRSLGYDERHLFDILERLGAYPGADNTDRISRTGDYLACRFPNGAVALAPHLKHIEEGWQGGFARDDVADRVYMEQNPAPSDAIHLKGYKVNGHSVTYEGSHALTFRLNKQGELIAFAGNGAKEIVVDGRRTVFADQPLTQIAWAPVPAERRVPAGAVLQISVSGEGTVRIPAVGLPQNVKIVREGPSPGSRGDAIESRSENGAVVFTLGKGDTSRWLYAVE